MNNCNQNPDESRTNRVSSNITEIKRVSVHINLLAFSLQGKKYCLFNITMCSAKWALTVRGKYAKDFTPI